MDNSWINYTQFNHLTQLNFDLIISNQIIMSKKILQIENISNEDLKNEILVGVRNILLDFNKNVEPNEVLLTRDETAKMLSISLVTLWKLTKKDKLPAFRIGTRVRYKKSDVIKALKKMNDFDNPKNKGYEY